MKQSKLKDIGSFTILVIGDVMLDKYISGDSHRMSPEAPVPVITDIETRYVLGGAGNVAANIKSLGSKPILLTICGNDENGNRIKSLLKEDNCDAHIIIDAKRVTSTKTRILANNKQIARIDEEVTNDINDEITSEIKQKISSILSSKNVDGVVFQDYNKGLFTRNNIKDFIKLCKEYNKPIFVDPKFENFWEYAGVDIFKPNKSELLAAYPKNTKSEIHNLAVQTYNRLKCNLLITTLAAEGILVCDGVSHIYPTKAIKNADVSGAGDTTLAAMSIAYLSSFNAKDIASIGNIAGSIVCKKQGVSTITIDEMMSFIAMN